MKLNGFHNIKFGPTGFKDSNGRIINGGDFVIERSTMKAGIVVDESHSSFGNGLVIQHNEMTHLIRDSYSSGSINGVDTIREFHYD